MKTMASFASSATMGGARKPPGPTKFHPWEFPRSGGKAIDVERREREVRGSRLDQNHCQ